MKFKSIAITTTSVCGATALAALVAGFASAEVRQSEVPATSIVPAAGEAAAAAPSAAPTGEETAPMSEPSHAAPEAAPTPHTAVKHRSTARHAATHENEVEPTKARLKILKGEWIYSEPRKTSKHLERAEVDHFVNVTGSTRNYLQVKLRNGETGYIDPQSVDLVKPTDKLFRLTKDAAVLEQPNHWGKKVSEVHQGHDVHAVGIALNYIKIRMRNGVEGYIPLTALE